MMSEWQQRLGGGVCKKRSYTRETKVSQKYIINLCPARHCWTYLPGGRTHNSSRKSSNESISHWPLVYPDRQGWKIVVPSDIAPWASGYIKPPEEWCQNWTELFKIFSELSSSLIICIYDHQLSSSHSATTFRPKVSIIQSLVLVLNLNYLL